MEKYGKTIRKTYKKQILKKNKNKNKNKNKHKNKNKSRKQKKQRGAGVKTANLNRVKIMYFPTGEKGNEKPGEFVVVNENGEENADIVDFSASQLKQNIEIKPQSIFNKLTKDIQSVESLLANIKRGYSGNVKQNPSVIETITFRDDEPFDEIIKEGKVQNKP